MSCKLVLLNSGVLLAHQTDIFLSKLIMPEDELQQKKREACKKQRTKTLSQKSSLPLIRQEHLGSRDDCFKAPHGTVVSLKDSKNSMGGSLLALHRTNSTSSLPMSPAKKKHSLEISKQLTLPITGIKVMDGEQLSKSNSCLNEAGQVKPTTSTTYATSESSQKISIVATSSSSSDTKSTSALKNSSLEGKGELKVLTSGALEHLSSVSLYPECPNTCLMEFECSEAGEISGDWALYFRSKNQLLEFLQSLQSVWDYSFPKGFPQKTIADADTQQFLLEGSMISSRGWTTTS